MVILYEDIKADPEAVCKKLLEVCEVPKEHVPLALEALKSDSQGGTFGRRADFFVLKHKSSIFRSVIQPCM